METTLTGNDKYLTKQEVKRFLDVIHSKRDRALFRLMYFIGMRASEPGDLQLSSYSPAERRLYVRRLKGSLASNPELSPDTNRVLMAWIRERGKEPGPLFPSNRGTGISRQQVWELVRKYARLAHIDPAKAHPHIFKHSLATHLLQSGVGLYQVKMLLGHKKITSTEVYLHIADVEMDNVARTFQDAW
jgi:site-specific recombinase XerD